jgi:transcriptional regulator with XRE-family HTH domain
MSDETIGERIRSVREEHGVNQSELARRSGVARNTINRIEHGHRIPSSETLEKLAMALDVEPGEFFPKARSLQGFDIEALLLEIFTEEPDLTRREALEIAFERATERFKNMSTSTLRAYVERLREKQRTLRDPANFDAYIRTLETREFLEILILAAERQLAGSRG